MAGAGMGRGKGPAVASGVVLGGFVLLGAVLLGVAATIVLSLISIYTNTNSKQTNGDFLRIKAFGLKSLYSTPAGYYFNNGAVADSSTLSSLCTNVFSSSVTSSNFAGCKATGFKASTGNASNVSRRRRQSELSVFMIGEIQIYFTTTCGQSRDIDKGSNATSLSDCVRTRLQLCNSLANSTVGFTLWSSSSVPTVSLSITANTSSSVTIQPNRIYAASKEQTASYAAANIFNNNATIQSAALLGCTYGGPISIAAIAAALTTNSTTTTAATTVASG